MRNSILLCEDMETKEEEPLQDIADVEATLP